MINNCMWLNLWGIHWQKVGGAEVKHVHVGGHEDVHDAYVVGHCVITVSASLLTRTGSVKSKSRSRWFQQHYCTGAKCQASLCGDFVVPIVHDFKVGMFKVTKVSPGLSEWSLAAPVMSQCTNKQKWIQKLARNPELLVAGSICNHAAAWHAWGQSAWHDPSVDCWPDCWQVSSQISSCAKSKCRLHIRLINREVSFSRQQTPCNNWMFGLMLLPLI